jgi:hypothetical protein
VHATTTAAVTPSARPTVMLAKRSFIMMARRWRDHGIPADSRQRLTNSQARPDIVAVRWLRPSLPRLKEKELGLGQLWHSTCHKKLL